MKVLDPAAPLLDALQEYVDAHPSETTDDYAAALTRIAAELGMPVMRVGAISVRVGERLEWNANVCGWSFDARAWVLKTTGKPIGLPRQRG